MGGRWDSNPRQPRSQPGALPTELRPPRLTLDFIYQTRLAGFEPATLGLEGRCSIQMSYRRKKIGVEGFEPPTSCSQSRRATRLRYTPLII
jgi:hypothetical protein